MKYLIAGIGNIGPEYADTRHNIGFDIADELAKQENISFRLDRHSFVSEFKFKGRTIYLLKPTTYVNLSGKAVKYWKDKLKIEDQHILAIIDDLALPFGKIRLKSSGSDGGHNGLRSIDEQLGTQNYPRLRFGIGNNFPKGRQSEYVLGTWTTEEWKELPDKIKTATDTVRSFTTIGIEKTMTLFNK